KAYDDQKKKITDQEELIKKTLQRDRISLAQDLVRNVSAYLLAEASGATSSGLDSETVERFRKYLTVPEKSHPFLGGWDRLRSSGARADVLRAEAERFQALVQAVLNEKKAIDDHNERVLEEAKKSKDAYDLFCKGCNVVTRALERDKF